MDFESCEFSSAYGQNEDKSSMLKPVKVDCNWFPENFREKLVGFQSIVKFYDTIPRVANVPK